jgi:hypothetical protein
MNIWTGLLFLDGAIGDAELARSLAGITAAAEPATTGNPDFRHPRNARDRALRRRRRASSRTEETTMNLFKGLLYLLENDTPASSKLIEAPRYGAATVAERLVEALGNRAASERQFGRPAECGELDSHGLAIGGCR